MLIGTTGELEALELYGYGGAELELAGETGLEEDGIDADEEREEASSSGQTVVYTSAVVVV